MRHPPSSPFCHRRTTPTSLSFPSSKESVPLIIIRREIFYTNSLSNQSFHSESLCVSVGKEEGKGELGVVGARLGTEGTGLQFISLRIFQHLKTTCQNCYLPPSCFIYSGLELLAIFGGYFRSMVSFFLHFFFFSVDDNDVPLLLAVAGTHAPQSITLVG